MSANEADFRGRWRIVETAGWDQDALDLIGPAEIAFGAGRGGELRMIAIGADIDYRVAERKRRARVEFLGVRI